MSRLLRLALASFALSLAGLSVGRAEVRPVETAAGRLAPKPLFRDPVYDGAADPVVIWNRAEKKWFMVYTNRRATRTELPGVSWVYGTRLGIAESSDGGATWTYRGVAKIGHGTEEDTHWAPDIIEHAGVYHMFLTFVPGTYVKWDGKGRIVHLASRDLLEWTFEQELPLPSPRTIDAGVFRLPDGTFRLWYNDEVDRKSIHYADSPDLKTWTDRGRAMPAMQSGEGAKVFFWKDAYWMIVDHWRGLGVYRSPDAVAWTRQPGYILDQPGAGEDDGVKGGHADVVVSEGRAFLFYFTHPGRRGPDEKKDGVEQRRSSLQVVELTEHEGVIAADRDAPTYVRLTPPE